MNRVVLGKFLLLLVMFFLVFGFSAQAQKKKYKDYLITNKDDTIYGKFKKPLMGQLRFESGDDMYELDASLYKAYYDSNEKKLYERKIINDKPMWLTCIINGKIKLYEQFYNTSQADGRLIMIRLWMAQKEGTPLMEVMSSGFKVVQNPKGQENLEYLIRDNENLFNKLQQTINYNYKTVRTYIEAYNSLAQ
ncbi:MAG: hypothetical protein DI598_04190 [Pseudopedobacter saltans]|uniref:Uncharacterized protein n=1 Tax=Pseudopedobacter saltans TaxID=151895 RepID=A0A2W5FBN4_9SPHI|nr:MAG: hypothetical protein DI598_04190 [Pseudopedobacter saltans]